MRFNSCLPVTLPLALALVAGGHSLKEGRASSQEGSKAAKYREVCKEIAEHISSASQVFLPGDAGYARDITTWSSTNTQRAACSVEPGTAQDVSSIIKVLGKTRTPFGIRGGGHSPNPGFTSTPGVLIAMFRFSDVKYNPSHKTAVVGAGLIWDQVYKALEPHGVSVVGGRVTGVGVAGFVLGGGYSWLTNQHGLALDTVVEYELVQPDGKIVTVTENSSPDLFFGLKGGFNNFGIVTKFTMKTFPQTHVWGGIVTYTEDSIPAVKAAVTKFVDTVSDPKASIITALNVIPGQIIVAQIIFYDAPNPPAGMFDAFMDIPSISEDISTRSLLSLVQSSPANLTHGQRNAFDTTPILNYTPRVIDAIINETMFWGSKLADKTPTILTYAIEPFTPDILSFNTVHSAYPPTRTHGLSPFDISYAWISSAYDKDFITAAKLSASHLRDVVLADGQTSVEGGTLYPNYAADGTPLEAMYGSNTGRLRKLKKQDDPENVMGLAGGFKF
ncbi:hypothetical protein AX15_001873 [Amanita polypyramis BW_CC]|nr:hypothetical protein AX15_001873 [Amanita polypyramis BW_CC]